VVSGFPARKALLAFGVGACVLLLMGMAALQPREVQLLQQSRFGELESMMRAEIKDPAAAPFHRLFYLCFAHARVKRYNELFPCLEQLQSRVDRGDRMLFVFDMSAVPALLRAEAYLELGDYPRSLEEAKKAQALVQGRNAYLQMRLYALTALGLGRAFNGDRAGALSVAGELAQVDTSYPHTLLATDKYVGLARIYTALGEHARALEAIRKDRETEAFRSFADAISGAGAAGTSLFTYWVLPKEFMLNRALFETGDVAAAKAGYDALLKLPQTRDNGEIHWLILADRGRIAEREGKRGEAIEFYRRAVEIIEQQRSTISTEAGKIGFVGDKQAVYRRLVAALFEEGGFDQAFEYVERSKARALVDLLAAKRDFAVPSGSAEEARALLAAADGAEAEQRLQLDPGRRAARGALESARRRLKEESPELASLVSVSAAPAAEVRALIPGGETLVEYYYGGADLFAFVLAADRLQAYRLDGQGLENEVRLFRLALENPRSERVQDLARRLYQRLIAPLAAELPEGRALVVVPHGALHYMPFAALHDGSAYLVDRHGLRLLPSASVLKFLPPRRPGAVVAFGNPDVGDRRHDLEHAQTEASAVAQLYPGARLLLRAQATETAFRQLGAGYTLVHVASHGEFDPEAPMRSALVLAPDPHNDGLLTLDELYSLRLDTRMVTLSACETGLGRLGHGDDVVGLTRGFLFAGARTVVASLWKVDDQATAELMTRFYRNLQGAGSAQALRQAQIETRATHLHPFFWAAFQVTGGGD
jgi:CHAT domain-containing protein